MKFLLSIVLLALFMMGCSGKHIEHHIPQTHKVKNNKPDKAKSITIDYSIRTYYRESKGICYYYADDGSKIYVSPLMCN